MFYIKKYVELRNLLTWCYLKLSKLYNLSTFLNIKGNATYRMVTGLRRLQKQLVKHIRTFVHLYLHIIKLKIQKSPGLAALSLWNWNWLKILDFRNHRTTSLKQKYKIPLFEVWEFLTWNHFICLPYVNI